jgi:hypothetical protein
MPFAADPNQTFKIILPTDAGKTPPPAFVCRYLTMRQWRQAAKLYDATFDTTDKDPDSVCDKILAVLALIVAGRENLPNAALEDLLTVYEARELMDMAWAGQRPGFEDKKKLSSPSDTVTENPAPGAAG